MLLKIVLLVIATWRLYRLLAQDTGPLRILRRIRIKLGVRYLPTLPNEPRFSKWETDDGSIGEMICCSRCAPLWEGMMLTTIMLFTTDLIFYLATVPLVAGAFTLAVEGLIKLTHGKEIN